MIILTHALAAVFLFFFTNLVGKNSTGFGYMGLSFNQPFNDSPAFNLTYRVFAPVAFITLLAALLYRLGLDAYVLDIYRIVVFYFAARFAFAVLTERLQLISHIQFWFIAALSVGCSMVAYDHVISKKLFLFPTEDELGSALWLGVIAFLYQTLNSISTSDSAQEKRVNLYVIGQYRKLKLRHWRIVDENADFLDKNFIYAVMVYESLNRPRIYAPLEWAKVRICGKASIGPMQVTTREPMSQSESIREGIRILQESFVRHSNVAEEYPGQTLSNVLNDYNPSPAYCWEVLRTLEIITEHGEA